MYEKDTYIKLFYRSFYLCQSKLNDNSLLKKKILLMALNRQNTVTFSFLCLVFSLV